MAFRLPKQNESLKFVGMALLGEALPEIVILELEDIRNDTSAIQVVREGASTVLRRIYSNVEVDVKSPEFIQLLTNLKTFTSLTQEQAVQIYTDLQAL